eukprot:CAMPEP_0197031124 /NCGR_PEP_ID=MMETSP1384-20130603/10219_1 /TAXON_ID=29189 /ORGANISM="Ammonia sp." /LENGTH=166 /DNA_ID=CAMNT_0042460609 /DNA_START=20 /DNA_END=517 /DNA_ORIENTATION=-
MTAWFGSAADQLLSFIGYDTPSPNAKLWGKVAVAGGLIGVSLMVAMLPVESEISKEVRIKKSAKEVYDFLTETPADKLWVSIHPRMKTVTSKRKYNNTEEVEVFEGHSTFPMSIVKRSASKTIELDCFVPLVLWMKLHFRCTMKMNEAGNNECRYYNVVRFKQPLW